MKLPFVWIALGFLLGILLQKYARIPVIWPAYCLSAGIVLLCFLRGSRAFIGFFVLTMMSAGFLWAGLDLYVPPSAVGNFTGLGRVALRGTVVSLPEIRTHGKKVTVSLVLDAKSVTRREKGWRRNFKASGLVQVFLIQPSLVPKTGDELRLYGELSAPRKAANPGEFDYRDYLAEKKIRAVFRTIGGRSVSSVKQGSAFAPSRALAAARLFLAGLIDKLYAAPEAAILKALTLGLRGEVPSQVRSHFMKTGTIHLLAISGMNITMIAGTFYLLLLFFGIGFRKTALATVLIVMLYVGLSGGGIPIQRAGYGAVLALLAIVAGRPSSLLNSLCFACFAILLWSPQSLWSVGFQLSFLCVLSLILILPLLSGVNRWMLPLGSSFAVLAGTFPVVLYYFNIFSPVSIVANIVAIPLCDAALFMSLVSLLFHQIPLLGAFLVKITSGILFCLLGWVKCLCVWRWGYVFLERPSLYGLIAYFACVAAILFAHRAVFPRKRFFMTLLVAVWAGLSVSFLIRPGRGTFELTVLSSGKNQIAHAHFSNGADWLMNAGRGFPSDQGAWLINPYLRSKGVRKLEGILLTDLSKKHSGGLTPVLDDFPVRYFLYPGSPGFSGFPDVLYKNLRRLGRKARTYGSGDEVRMDFEEIRVTASSKKGTVCTIVSGPWRILVISRWDEGLFRELLEKSDPEEVHVVSLPAFERGIPAAFYEWLDRSRPALAVLPAIDPDLGALLASRRIAWLETERFGALNFRCRGSRLTIDSFHQGPLGFFAYF